MTAPKTHEARVRLHQDQAEMVHRYCDRHGITLAAFVDDLIRQELKKAGWDYPRKYGRRPVRLPRPEPEAKTHVS